MSDGRADPPTFFAPPPSGGPEVRAKRKRGGDPEREAEQKDHKMPRMESPVQGHMRELVVSSSEPSLSRERKGTGTAPRWTAVDTAHKKSVGTGIAPRGRSASEPPPGLPQTQRGSKRKLEDDGPDAAEMPTKMTKYAHGTADRGYNSDPENCASSTSCRSRPTRKSSSATQRRATKRGAAVRGARCVLPTRLSAGGVKKVAVSDDGLSTTTTTELEPVAAGCALEVRPRAKPEIPLAGEDAEAEHAGREASFREALWDEFTYNAAVFERARLEQRRARQADASRLAAQAEALGHLVDAIHEGIMSRAREEGGEVRHLLVWHVVVAMAILLAVLACRYASE